MSYYDGDPWSNHVLNEVKCAECEEYFDDQEGEGNICPPCVAKGYGEEMKAESYQIVIEVTTESDPSEWDNQTICGDHLILVKECGCLR